MIDTVTGAREEFGPVPAEGDTSGQGFVEAPIGIEIPVGTHFELEFEDGIKRHVKHSAPGAWAILGGPAESALS